MTTIEALAEWAHRLRPVDGRRRDGADTNFVREAPIHQRPQTGMEGKFSLEYGVATAVVDTFPSLDSFSDTKVRRPDAIRIMKRVTTSLKPVGDGLLDGTCDVELGLSDGRRLEAAVRYAPGSPMCPHRRRDGCQGPRVPGGPAEGALLTTWGGAA